MPIERPPRRHGRTWLHLALGAHDEPRAPPTVRLEVSRPHRAIVGCGEQIFVTVKWFERSQLHPDARECLGRMANQSGLDCKF